MVFVTLKRCEHEKLIEALDYYLDTDLALLVEEPGKVVDRPEFKILNPLRNRLHRLYTQKNKRWCRDEERNKNS